MAVERRTDLDRTRIFPRARAILESGLTSLAGTCIRFCMTNVLTIRLEPELLNKAEAKAARLGLDRAKYIRSLIEGDLARGPGKPSRSFASEDLAGMYEGGGRAATNAATRRRLQKRAKAGA